MFYDIANLLCKPNQCDDILSVYYIFMKNEYDFINPTEFYSSNYINYECEN